MNTTAVVITAIIFGSSLVMGIIMSLIEYIELKYKAGVKMEDKLKLEIVETLVDICFVLEELVKYRHADTRSLRSHANELAMLSSQYREKIIPKEEEMKHESID